MSHGVSVGQVQGVVEPRVQSIGWESWESRSVLSCDSYNTCEAVTDGGQCDGVVDGDVVSKRIRSLDHREPLHRRRGRVWHSNLSRGSVWQCDSDGQTFWGKGYDSLEAEGRDISSEVAEVGIGNLWKRGDLLQHGCEQQNGRVIMDDREPLHSGGGKGCSSNSSRSNSNGRAAATSATPAEAALTFNNHYRRLLMPTPPPQYVRCMGEQEQ